jgi:hypothetical protein
MSGFATARFPRRFAGLLSAPVFAACTAGAQANGPRHERRAEPQRFSRHIPPAAPESITHPEYQNHWVPEERIAGLKPEEILTSLKPEEIITGLPPEQIVALKQMLQATPPR